MLATVTFEVSTLEVADVRSLPSSRIIRNINAMSSTNNRYKMVLFSAFYIFFSLFVSGLFFWFCFSEMILACRVLILFGFVFFLLSGMFFLPYVWLFLSAMGLRLRFKFIWCRKPIIFFFSFIFKPKRNYEEYNNNNYLVQSKTKEKKNEKNRISDRHSDCVKDSP